MHPQKIIVAIATPPGAGAIAVIRLSGNGCLNVLDNIFKGKTIPSEALGNTVIYGHIIDNKSTLDEVLVTIFRAPISYTGEDVAEISCHGSIFIQKSIVELLIRNGAAMAAPGEFTQRAYLNGKMDLLQAEAVADLIAAESSAMHSVAINQMRGGFSKELSQLRDKLIEFASLIELELDFSLEDVEFANKDELLSLCNKMITRIETLITSFKLGNAIKNGIPVTIAGRPNAGKSTLLNALLNEERAIVSEIAGTTRDTIEELLIIDGIEYRIIDTAGLRQSDDAIEQIGIQKSYNKIQSSSILIYIFDISNIVQISDFKQEMNEVLSFNVPCIFIANKIDKASKSIIDSLKNISNLIYISAKAGTGLDNLKSSLVNLSVGKNITSHAIIVSNVRHYEALLKTRQSLLDVNKALKLQIPSDLIAIDLRKALFHLGEITGSISTEELLGSIFGSFCIGK